MANLDADAQINTFLKNYKIPEPLPANAVVAIVMNNCPHCHELMRETMKDGKIAEQTADGRPIVYVDVLTPEGATFYQAHKLQNMHVTDTPTLLATDADGKITKVIVDGAGQEPVSKALHEFTKPPAHVQAAAKQATSNLEGGACQIASGKASMDDIQALLAPGARPTLSNDCIKR